VVQNSRARSGDAIAGSQVTGVVGGNATVQNSNMSFGAVAVSGPVVAGNVAVVNAGPTAGGGGSAQQIGNNSTRVIQNNVAESGAAVAGSQVTGIVGGGNSTVQNQNLCVGCVAVSGAVVSVNAAFVNAGPQAAGGQASQIGNNDAVLVQASDVRSGDAIAGGQVTGLVGGGGTVQNSNFAAFPVAVSGPAIALNIAASGAGPSSGGGLAQTSQFGSNTVLADQQANVRSGDAVAGSQVTGMVSSQLGSLAVQNQQASIAPIAVSGAAVAVNVLAANAGPTSVGAGIPQAQQLGNNNVRATQVTDVRSGDAVAGGQVVGAVGGSGVIQGSNFAILPVAVSGPAVGLNFGLAGAGPSASGGGAASASQFGSNTSVLDQEVRAASGDAVAGGQVVGAVGGPVAVQIQNTALVPIAVSGPAIGLNFGLNIAGPAAAGAGFASASQFGSNVAELGQIADTSSGDAVSGSQVVGIVGGFGSRIQGGNTALLPIALTSLATSFNAAAGGAGPQATGGVASTSQAGNNIGRLFQLAPVASGDAVSGSEVFGVV
jgi:hypothetical protein